MSPTTRFELPPEGTLAFDVVMLAANDAARNLAALEQIPAEADAALVDAAQRDGFPADVLSSAGYDEARAVREALREQMAALRRDVVDLLADAMLVFEDAHPKALAVANVEPRITPAPRPPTGVGELGALEAAGVVVQVVRWQAELTKHSLGVVDDAITKLGDALNAHHPENAALLERLRFFVETTTRGGAST
jgi:hypothetical protein